MWDERSLLHLKAILHKFGINEPEIGPSNRAGNEGIQYGEFVTDLMNWKDAPKQGEGG